MSTAYRITQQNDLHFLTFQVVQWVDVFTRRIYRDILMGYHCSQLQARGLLLARHSEDAMPNTLRATGEMLNNLKYEKAAGFLDGSQALFFILPPAYRSRVGGLWGGRRFSQEPPLLSLSENTRIPTHEPFRRLLPENP